MSEPRASYETYLSHSMFVENIKECLTEIFKHVILMSEKQFIENIIFFFFLKMFIPLESMELVVKLRKRHLL